MSKIRIAINGFGRIGRLAFRNLIDHDSVEVVAVNDLTRPEMLMHLLKYDTAHGPLNKKVSLQDKTFSVEDQEVKIFNEKDPAQLPWKSLKVDVVLESTGVFLSREKASLHLEAGAGKVVLSAPAKSDDIKTVVLGVNEQSLTSSDRIISNASCTTNCLAPMAKVVQERFGIEKGFMTTVHAYTADQNIQDAPHQKDMRRARAAAASIIPTSTGAAKAVALVMPELKGKLDGMAMRVPVITGSITDCNFILKEKVSAEDINQAMKEAADSELSGILQYTEDPIVSSDIIGNKHSCIFDSKLTSVQGEFIKMAGWYDNEAGYAARVAEMSVYAAKLT